VKREYNTKVEQIEKCISKLQGQIPQEEHTSPKGKEQANQKLSRNQGRKASGRSEFATTGKLKVSSLQLIHIDNDLEEIGQSTIDHLNHGSPRSARVGALLRETIGVGK
jgi:ribosomal protein L2